MVDLRFCAHFPFSDEAKDYARLLKLSLDEEALRGGEERLKQALGPAGEIKPGLELESDLAGRLLHYAASRMILAAWKNRYAIRRMAVAESKLAHKFLRSEGDKRAGYAPKLAASLGILFTEAPNAGREALFLLPFWQYLLYTPRDVHYKLVNMPLASGFVTVSGEQRLRILEEAVKKRLEDGPLPALKEPPAEITAAIKRLEPLLPRETLAPTQIGAKDFPPCIRKMLDDLAMSINVPHSGRLSLAIYLIKAGLSDEQIVSVFSHAPDFSKETTAYQVNYIRQKAYSMPSCATMDTYGLCIAACRCFSPVKYKEAVHGRYARESMASSGQAEPSASLDANKESKSEAGKAETKNQTENKTRSPPAVEPESSETEADKTETKNRPPPAIDSKS
ncbi:MAG: hypothetical protein V1728_01025 [Candidatus Micrarchaeota archaeon]